MLDNLERAILTEVGRAVGDRPGLSVVRAPAELPGEAEQAVQVGIAVVRPKLGFERSHVQVGEAAAASQPLRRLLPVAFEVRIDVLLHTSLDSDQDRDIPAARALLLRDLSMISHHFAADEVRSGKGLRGAAEDPGFEIQALELEDGYVEDELEEEEVLRGRLTYQGTATIWPPRAPEQGNLITAIDGVIVPQPIRLLVDPPIAPAGSRARLRIPLVRPSFLDPRDQETRPELQLSVQVVSDLPPGQRGSLALPGSNETTGTLVISQTETGSELDYVAPSDLGGVVVEYVAVHLATPSGASGAHLGSAEVRLTS